MEIGGWDWRMRGPEGLGNGNPHYGDWMYSGFGGRMDSGAV